MAAQAPLVDQDEQLELPAADLLLLDDARSVLGPALEHGEVVQVAWGEPVIFHRTARVVPVYPAPEKDCYLLPPDARRLFCPLPTKDPTP